MKHFWIYMTRYFISLGFRIPAILHMSSWKRMTLNKTRLTDNRNPLFEDLPAINTKTKIHHMFISIQKEQILVYWYTFESKNTGGNSYCSHFSGNWKYASCHWATRGSKFLSNLIRKVSWASMYLLRVKYPTTDLLCPPEIIFLRSHSEWPKASNLSPTLYPQSWVFSCFVVGKLIWRIFLWFSIKDKLEQILRFTQDDKK